MVLLAEDTHDEAYFWIPRRKEQEMQDELQSLMSVADDVESELGVGHQRQLGEFEGADSAADGPSDLGGASDATATSNAEANGTSTNFTEYRLSPGLTDSAEQAESADSTGSETAAGGVDTESSSDDDAADQVTVATAGSYDETVETVIDQRELNSTIARGLSIREDDLLAVDGVGQVTAERIREVVGSDYEE